MSDHLTEGQRALATLLREHTGSELSAEALEMVAEGASGRCIMRATAPGCGGIIGIYWTPDRADNGSFLPAAHGLQRAGVQVPAVLAERELANGCGACLVEDLGRQSLLSLREELWPTRRAAYAAALRQLHRLHSAKADWPLQPPFDTELYRWEQGYFAEHYLQRHRGLSEQEAQQWLHSPAAQELAHTLAALPRCPIHRDFQSQNIMLRGGEAWLIDFQGMRHGLPEYDLAALICDPYMELSAEEQAELLELWAHITAAPLRQDVYAACALQRLMQALGAFANIGYNAHRPWYLKLIPAGERALQQTCATAPPHSPAARLALCLQPFVTPSV